VSSQDLKEKSTGMVGSKLKTPQILDITDDNEFQAFSDSKAAFKRQRGSYNPENYIFGKPALFTSSNNDDVNRVFDNICQLGDSIEKTNKIMKKDQRIISLTTTEVSSKNDIPKENLNARSHSTKSNVIFK
jgi:hypothetical protein